MLGLNLTPKNDAKQYFMKNTDRSYTYDYILDLILLINKYFLCILLNPHGLINEKLMKKTDLQYPYDAKPCSRGATVLW